MDEQRTPTATLTIRRVDAALKERLRVRAAQHGHSMEAELRDILQETLKEPEPPEVATVMGVKLPGGRVIAEGSGTRER